MLLANAVIETVLPGRDVVLPTVPRARYDVAVDDPFGNRPAGMSTNAVDRMHTAVDLKQREDTTASDDFSAGPRTEILETSHANFLTHVTTPFVTNEPQKWCSVGCSIPVTEAEDLVVPQNWSNRAIANAAVEQQQQRTPRETVESSFVRVVGATGNH